MAGHRTDQREFWDLRAGAWERRADALDAMSDDYGAPAMDALGLAGGEHVLDVGCGPGTTAIELARRVGADGSVVGVDISPAMIAVARRRAEAAGAGNARFVVADVQRDPFGERFDAAYSRFGVMFFDAAPAAFARLSGSMRTGARLACCVWGAVSDNPWMTVPTLAALGPLEAELDLPGPDAPGPFSLGDPARVDEVLTRGGFADVRVDRLDGTRRIVDGPTGDNLRTHLEVGPLGDAFLSADDARQARALDAAAGALEPYRDGDGWRLPRSALLVTARRP